VSALISVPDLWAVYARPDRPTVVDVRWSMAGPSGVEAYRAGHLPGAGFADLDRDLSAPPGDGGRHPLPGTGGFQAAMRRLGVRAGRPVVVYDQRDATIAARLWWLLRYFGHSQVRALDGGYEAWLRAGHPVATGDEPAGEPGRLSRHAGRRAARDGRRRARGGRGAARCWMPGSPSGTAARSSRSTRWPGTFRVRCPRPHSTTSTPTAGSRPAARSRRTAGSGVTAAHEVLALLAGIEAALYVGSWSEWIRDPNREVATGP
jgi:thiosulfate/3-mercaptopyruvate sulfurtransferase